MNKLTRMQVENLERRVDRQTSWINDDIRRLRRDLTAELNSLRREVSDLRFRKRCGH